MGKSLSPLGMLLRERRQELGLTLAQLSKALGHATSQQMLSNWELGKGQPPEPILSKLADTLKVNIETVRKARDEADPSQKEVTEEDLLFALELHNKLAKPMTVELLIQILMRRR